MEAWKRWERPKMQIMLSFGHNHGSRIRGHTGSHLARNRDHTRSNHTRNRGHTISRNSYLFLLILTIEWLVCARVHFRFSDKSNIHGLSDIMGLVWPTHQRHRSRWYLMSSILSQQPANNQQLLRPRLRVPSFENQKMNGNWPWRFLSPFLLMFL